MGPKAATQSKEAEIPKEEIKKEENDDDQYSESPKKEEEKKASHVQEQPVVNSLHNSNLYFTSNVNANSYDHEDELDKTYKQSTKDDELISIIAIAKKSDQKTLDCSKKDLISIQAFLQYSLKILSLKINNNLLTHISEVNVFLELVSLDASHNQVKTIQPDLYLKNLRTLNLSDNNFDKMPNIHNLPQLADLNIEKNNISTFYQIPNAEPIKTLQKFNISYNSINNIVEFVEFLNYLEFIEILNFENNPVIADKEPLQIISKVLENKNLSKLRKINKIDRESVKEEHISEEQVKIKDVTINEINTLFEQIRFNETKDIENIFHIMEHCEGVRGYLKAQKLTPKLECDIESFFQNSLLLFEESSYSTHVMNFLCALCSIEEKSFGIKCFQCIAGILQSNTNSTKMVQCSMQTYIVNRQFTSTKPIRDISGHMFEGICMFIKCCERNEVIEKISVVLPHWIPFVLERISNFSVHEKNLDIDIDKKIMRIFLLLENAMKNECFSRMIMVSKMEMKMGNNQLISMLVSILKISDKFKRIAKSNEKGFNKDYYITIKTMYYNILNVFQPNLLNMQLQKEESGGDKKIEDTVLYLMSLEKIHLNLFNSIKEDLKYISELNNDSDTQKGKTMQKPNINDAKGEAQEFKANADCDDVKASKSETILFYKIASRQISLIAEFCEITKIRSEFESINFVDNILSLLTLDSINPLILAAASTFVLKYMQSYYNPTKVLSAKECNSTLDSIEEVSIKLTLATQKIQLLSNAIQFIGGPKYQHLIEASRIYLPMNEQEIANLDYLNSFKTNKIEEVHSAFIALINLIKYFSMCGSKTKQSRDKALLYPIYDNVCAVLNKLNREERLLDSLNIPNDKVKLVVVQCLNEVKLEEIDAQEISSIVTVLLNCKNINVGETEKIVSNFFWLISKILLTKDDNLGCFRSFKDFYGKTVTDFVLQILKINVSRKFNNQSEAAEKEILTQSCMLYLYAASQIKELNNLLQNVSPVLIELIMNNYENNKSQWESQRIEFEWTAIGENLKMMLILLSSIKELSEMSKIMYFIRIADLLQGVNNEQIDSNIFSDQSDAVLVKFYKYSEDNRNKKILNEQQSWEEDAHIDESSNGISKVDEVLKEINVAELLLSQIGIATNEEEYKVFKKKDNEILDEYRKKSKNKVKYQCNRETSTADNKAIKLYTELLEKGKLLPRDSEEENIMDTNIDIENPINQSKDTEKNKGIDINTLKFCVLLRSLNYILMNYSQEKLKRFLPYKQIIEKLYLMSKSVNLYIYNAGAKFMKVVFMLVKNVLVSNENIEDIGVIGMMETISCTWVALANQLIHHYSENTNGMLFRELVNVGTDFCYRILLYKFESTEKVEASPDEPLDEIKMKELIIANILPNKCVRNILSIMMKIKEEVQKEESVKREEINEKLVLLNKITKFIGIYAHLRKSKKDSIICRILLENSDKKKQNESTCMLSRFPWIFKCILREVHVQVWKYELLHFLIQRKKTEVQAKLKCIKDLTMHGNRLTAIEKAEKEILEKIEGDTIIDTLYTLIYKEKENDYKLGLIAIGKESIYIYESREKGLINNTEEKWHSLHTLLRKFTFIKFKRMPQIIALTYSHNDEKKAKLEYILCLFSSLQSAKALWMRITDPNTSFDYEEDESDYIERFLKEKERNILKADEKYNLAICGHLHIDNKQNATLKQSDIDSKKSFMPYMKMLVIHNGEIIAGKLNMDCILQYIRFQAYTRSHETIDVSTKGNTDEGDTPTTYGELLDMSDVRKIKFTMSDIKFSSDFIGLELKKQGSTHADCFISPTAIECALLYDKINEVN